MNMLHLTQSWTQLRIFYDILFFDLADPRTKDWFLLHSPLPGICILVLYLYFALHLGPQIMKNRKPFEMKYSLFLYNLIQIYESVYLFYNHFIYAHGWKYNWRCEPVDFSYNEDAIMIASTVHHYFLVKLSELLDTVFFVLRKKNNQVTFLHVYHHTIMPIVSWGSSKYYPVLTSTSQLHIEFLESLRLQFISITWLQLWHNLISNLKKKCFMYIVGGHGVFIGFTNSFVHIFMYTYYLLSGCGPTMRKYLWWKKYLTLLQLLQFCSVFIHMMQLLFYDCGYPRWTSILIVPNAIFFYFLFTDFYRKTYKTNPKICLETSENSTNRKEEICKANGKCVDIIKEIRGNKTNHID